MNLQFDLTQLVSVIANIIVMSLVGARLYYGLRGEIRSNSQETSALREQMKELKSEVALRRDDDRIHDHEARIRILEMQNQQG